MSQLKLADSPEKPGQQSQPPAIGGQPMQQQQQMPPYFTQPAQPPQLGMPMPQFFSGLPPAAPYGWVIPFPVQMSTPSQMPRMPPLPAQQMSPSQNHPPAMPGQQRFQSQPPPMGGQPMQQQQQMPPQFNQPALPPQPGMPMQQQQQGFPPGPMKNGQNFNQPPGMFPQQPERYPQQPGQFSGQFPEEQPSMGGKPNFGGQFPASPMQAAPQRPFAPNEIFNPVQVMAENQRTAGGPFSTLQVGQIPPLVTTDFVTQDQGNSGPRYVRSTMYNVPATTDMMKQSAVPFALVISPFARSVE